jgi:hypothetical protein
MQIVCTTTRAAAAVLSILLGAHLRPGYEFRVTGPMPPSTPVYFSFSAPIAAYLVEQLQAIPDTTIVESAA